MSAYYSAVSKALWYPSRSTYQCLIPDQVESQSLRVCQSYCLHSLRCHGLTGLDCIHIKLLSRDISFIDILMLHVLFC
jgi:hypothetical protein